MRVLILGVGDAFTARHFGTSALVEHDGRHVLIDCPDPIHRVLREATLRAGWSTDAASIDDIILTHLHGDHSNGLESFGFFRRFLGLSEPPRVRPRLHAATPVLERVWQKLAPAMDGRFAGAAASRLEDYFDPRPLRTDVSNDVAGLRVECRVTGHPVPTIGLLINDGAWTFGWSGDTPFEQAHVDWLARADVIVHESNRGPAHTPIERLNALDPSLRRRIRLIHLPDEFDESSTDIGMLRQGDVLRFYSATG
jgi:ribonuclease BN (tRNA processing enzyme)